MGKAPEIYTIGAGRPFARDLAAKLLQEAHTAPEALADTLILLPTRRACRTLQDAFLQQSEGRALILPRIQPIGDIDEEELSLSLAACNADVLNIPPAISPVRRQILLARLVQKLPGWHQGFDHALVLAAALGRFMDQAYTEGRNLADLHKIVPEDFADHWQITLTFLQVLSEAWPEILAEENSIDAADRRDRLIRTLSRFWPNNPPPGPVIAAGTTGSIPAVAELLGVIANLPKGMIVLPGLDRDMDEESWKALDETHPQFGLKHLLESMHVHRMSVKDWTPAAFKTTPQNDPSQTRRALAREIMRPAETTKHWITLGADKTTQQHFASAFEGLSLHECENEREEAQTVALLMREILETPGKTAALITPDRALARAAAMMLERWGVIVDDSAGRPLSHTNAGTFALLATQACTNALSPVSLLALLKHGLCIAAPAQKTAALEIHLRGPKPKPGFNGLDERLARARSEEKNTDEAESLLRALKPALNPFLSLCENDRPFDHLLRAHITMIETLAGGPELLWQEEDGEALSEFFTALLDHARDFPVMNAKTYGEILSHMMAAQTVRPRYGTHPRLAILGQLEARLVGADLVILGGLNEGTWPPDPGHDPWMSRPMRKTFGLPAHERSIGLAAHDFVQGFCAPRVAITRALRKDGAPAIPARWLQRLSTVLQAAGLDETPLHAAPHTHWTAQLDLHETVTPAPRPAPAPPADKRPSRLSATQVETWMKDPYAIYARHILRLKKLDPLEQPADAALRGTILHDVLDEFTRRYPDALPDNAPEILCGLAENHLQKHGADEGQWQFWRPRFERIAAWYAAHEKDWRAAGAKPLKTEIEGAIALGDFTLTARADRIDNTPGGLAVIDYKSGGNFTKKEIATGKSPQLSLSGLIAIGGGFQGIPAGKSASMLCYWVLSGKAAEPGKIIEAEGNASDIIARTRAGLENMIAVFADPATPYYAEPDAGNLPRFSDYRHLARTKEWAALEDSEEAA